MTGPVRASRPYDRRVGSPEGPTYANAFVIADRTAAWGQRTHLRLTRLELGLLILAAASGLIGSSVGDRRLDVGGLVAVILFALTLALRAYRMSTRPTSVWQDARAAAESIKTLCWRYAAGSRLFPPDMDDAAADRLFVERLADVLGGIRDLPTVQQTPSSPEEVTTWMRGLRASPLDRRRTAYERDRIADQQRWYAAKSDFNRLQAQRWSLVVLSLEFLGVVIGAVKAFGLLSSDTLGGVALAVVATVGAAAAAWVQTKQYATLASAYAIANEELASIRALVAHATGEAEWAEFVDSAERAISREHTMWRASRTT